MAPKTLFRYKQFLDSRILPAMGHMKLEEVKSFHIMQFYNNLQEDGIRLLSVPSFVLDMLRLYGKECFEQRLKVGDMWQGSDRLFTTWDGQPGYPDWPSQWFSKFIKKHNLPHLDFHGLRHTAATMLINQNVPLKNISGRLGHANPATTGSIYSHYLQTKPFQINWKMFIRTSKKIAIRKQKRDSFRLSLFCTALQLFAPKNIFP